jgi:transcriptional regulator with XRE-family HTH domain
MAEKTLGERLRELRGEKGMSLRQAAAKADVNPGYLSQLERDEIDNPSPAILQKLAEAYEEPFIALMRWAGYVEEGISPNQARALKLMGDDITDDELKVLREVLNAIRSTRAATFAFARLDGHLSDDDRARIRGNVLATLRRADVLGEIPTPLPQVMEVSNLVAAGEIALEPELQRKLRSRFGDLVDRALARLLGAIRFDSREVYVKHDLFWLKRRFVQAHEVGHDILPWHNKLYAFLDDKTRLTPEFDDLYERQANQAAIELLAQGDRLRREADDSPITIDAIDLLGRRFQISTHATVRNVVEESKQEVAVAISHFGMYGKVMPAHLYCSRSFEARFRWQATGAADALIHQLLLAAKREQALEPLLQVDVRDRAGTIELEPLRTKHAVFVLFRSMPAKSRRLAQVAMLR